MSTDPQLREKVRRRYAEAATGGSCCGPSSDCIPDASLGVDLTANTYSVTELESIPSDAADASLGCGNPTAVAELGQGETVLDLGSGGGIDVLLSARRVGPTGFVYGLDMTDEMIELARANAKEAGDGYIEEIPLADDSVDVIISNCVINLSTDKPAVFSEISRVLRPGGRLGVTDIVAGDDLTPEQRAERGSWVGCVAGALSYGEYRAQLEAVGFTGIDLTPTHAAAEGMDSVIIKAQKPLS